jgi:hypothetical protein
LSNLNDVNKNCEMNDVGKMLRPDRMFCGPEKFGKGKLGNEMDLALDVCESVGRQGTRAEQGFGSELQDKCSQSEIGIERATESRGNQPNMNPNPNHLPPGRS